MHWPADSCDRELHAEPCSFGATEWHARSLAALRSAALGGPIDACRAQFHERMLHCRQGQGRRPLVSIVIPVWNESEQILRTTVQSALDQSYAHCEILLVDDGSEPPAADRLRELASRIRIIRQPNRGVAEARNRGIAEARGEFIHFLDADDLLDRECVERKLDVFLQVPDADLCYSLYRCEGDNGVKSAANHEVPEVGDEFCPSRGLLRTILKRFPFQISTVMAPRWVWLDAGPFEPDLRQSQDNRHWFKMALRGTKVAGLKTELSTRRFSPGSLTSRADESAWYSLFSYIRNLIELCERPPLWTCIPAYWRRVLTPTRFELLFYSEQPEVEQLRGKLLESFRRMADRQWSAGLSCGPVVEVLQHRTIDSRLIWSPDRASAFQQQLLDVLDEAEDRAHPISGRDYSAWLECPTSRSFVRENQPALRQLEQHLRSHHGPSQAASNDARRRLREMLVAELPNHGPVGQISREATRSRSAA